MNKAQSKYFNTAIKMDQAFIALLAEKPFEYITVSELCAKAGVNRSTFYLHYENTCDLLKETVQYLIDDFLACFSVAPAKCGIDFTSCDLSQLNFITEQYLLPYLTYIRDNRFVFSTALSNANILGLFSVFQQLFQDVFNPILNRFHYPTEHRPYVMVFYLNGITAIVAHWLENNCKEPIETVCQIIQECIFGLDRV